MGTIVLDGAYQRKDDSKFKAGYFSKEKKIFGWVIAVNKPKMRDYLVYTNKEETRKEWMDAIDGVLQQWETLHPKRELILAGGMGAAKGSLPPPVMEEEGGGEEGDEDLEEAYLRFQNEHKHCAARHTHLRFKQTLKRHRCRTGNRQDKLPEEEGVIYPLCLLSSPLLFPPLLPSLCLIIHSPPSLYIILLTLLSHSHRQMELRGVLGLCLGDYKKRVPVLADVCEGVFAYCKLRSASRSSLPFNSVLTLDDSYSTAGKAVLWDYTNPQMTHAESASDLGTLRKKRVGSMNMKALTQSLPTDKLPETSKQRFLFDTTQGWIFKGTFSSNPLRCIMLFVFVLC